MPERPTREQAAAALAALWRPFEQFPFVGPLARAAHLAALLTAAVRPALPTAPAFGYDAPTIGSGKTLLARCVSALATGGVPSMFAVPTGRDDEEMRKLLTAILIDGDRAVVFDNIMGAFNSGTFAKVLTSGEHSDRVLTTSMKVKAAVKTLFLLTGNNLTLAGDMPRRVITCRIDPQMETPFARSFDLDPERYCLSNRQMLVAGALTLMRFFLAAGVARPGKGRMASFEAWDDWVRQTVLYVERVLAPGQFGDVMALVTSAQRNDPEHEAWYHALHALRGRFSGWFTAKDVAQAFNSAAKPYPAASDADVEVREAFLEYASGRDTLSSRSAGRILKTREGRIAGGLRLATGKDAHAGTLRFRVDDEGDQSRVVDVRAWRDARLAG